MQDVEKQQGKLGDDKAPGPGSIMYPSISRKVAAQMEDGVSGYLGLAGWPTGMHTRL